MNGPNSTLIGILLLSAVISIVGKECLYPLSVLCSDAAIAKDCQVEKQCELWNLRSVKESSAPAVNITVYYESLCPDSMDFIEHMLYPTWKTLQLSGIMNLQIVPYGNAKEEKVGDKYNFTCQHGRQECRYNLIETCTLHYENFTTAFEVIHCMTIFLPDTFAYRCFGKFGADYKQIRTCATGDLGNQLEHDMAEQTDRLEPPHTYVPWLTLNGVHSEDIQTKAQDDLLSLVCATYQGPPPMACSPSD